MIKLDFDNDEKCRVCRHFGFCQVYWGSDCKRQGGNRTPRVKRSVVTTVNASNKQKAMIEVTIPQSFEPIRTRRVNWY